MNPYQVSSPPVSPSWQLPEAVVPDQDAVAVCTPEELAAAASVMNPGLSVGLRTNAVKPAPGSMFIMPPQLLILDTTRSFVCVIPALVGTEAIRLGVLLLLIP